MLKIIPAAQRHFNDFGWLQTYWLFSFGDYYDQDNVQHGALRVFNDDIVKPHTGFGRHPHEEMEIVSIVLEGEMVHRDTMGNEATIRTGDVQRMTAGTGLFHSEQNVSDDPVHFCQIWISPDKRGLTPSYDQRNFSPEHWQNRLALLASGRKEEGVVTLNSEASIYRAALTGDNALTYPPARGRGIFVYVMAGQLAINGEALAQGDQGRISGEGSLDLAALGSAEFLLVDVPGALG